MAFYVLMCRFLTVHSLTGMLLLLFAVATTAAYYTEL